MIFAFLILITSVVVSIYTEQAALLFVPISFYLLGLVLIVLLSDKDNKGVYSKLYSISYMTFLIYATICFIYMREHNYSCLLVTDTITSYIPAVQDFMRLDSLKDGWSLLYGDFRSQAYSHAGIILFYWTLVGKYGLLFGNELYFSLQVSIIFLSAFVPIFLYRLLSQCSVNNPYKYSLVYCFCSVFFYYSSLILRDAPIALFYMIAFSYLFSGETVKKNVVFALLFLLTFFIRPQNGFFLLLFYFISFFSDGKRNRTSVLLLAIVAIAISYISIRLDIVEALEHNAFYAEKNIAQESEGLINVLDRLPPIIAELSKAMYIHISPIPSWLHLGFSSLNESNNIMSFPRSFAVIYNFIILGGILFGILHIRRFHFGNKKILVFLATLLYLLLQTSSTEQRRIMICYPLVYLFAIIVYQNIPNGTRNSIIQTSVLAFVIIQLVTLI